MLKTYKITISGQVQGVGFRPFIYGLASEFSLTGTVSNNEEGVVVFITGLVKDMQHFYAEVLKCPPPVSLIKNSSISEIELMKYADFKIVPSQTKGQLNLPLTPDFAICNDCIDDIQDIENYRYNYPFTTCVNCGPRWAITQTFPFERHHTSIDKFKMCDSCKSEYTNPSDRRFHSQTNTCNTCGISLYLVNNKGTKVVLNPLEIFEKAAELLSKGNIIAIKNTSGYLLCCNAEDESAIQNLRSKKNRPNKPFAVLYPSLDFLQKEIALNKSQIKSLTSTKRPITIIPILNYNGNIALNSVAPQLKQLGVMLPYSGILQLLANKLSFPIIATSGNIHSAPIISKNEDAFEKLKYIADYFIQHNLQITHPQDDSVVKFSTKFSQEIMFRRSRGYAPNYFDAQINSTEKIMAMGAHLKSSIAFFPNQYLYISQYLGNLDNFDVYKRFTNTAQSFIQIFEQNPEVVLIDKHPLYQSSQYGKELSEKLNCKLIEVQHHKAHFTAILGEHNLFNKKVLGVVFDGTGYGEDSAIWGGEFFSYASNKIKRINHVDYFDWLLGDKMSKEPRISLLSLSNPEMATILAQKFTANELKTYQSIIKTNTLKTSSVGRLFDAVASLLNIADYNSYEGEAAILLENHVTDYELASCKSYLPNYEDSISAKSILKNIYADLINGISKENIIVNFLFTLASSILKTARNHHFTNIALSGGVFQNTTLIDMLIALAPKEKKLYFHKDLPPNDENISFGQIMYYLNIKK
ncbi:MAG: carbamoyltransferase HypF [Flavobacteriaceae bacterium]|nr:carbamoyltransferase HypF [Flavobacteriaceae bacterium]